MRRGHSLRTEFAQQNIRGADRGAGCAEFNDDFSETRDLSDVFGWFAEKRQCATMGGGPCMMVHCHWAFVCRHPHDSNSFSTFDDLIDFSIPFRTRRMDT